MEPTYGEWTVIGPGERNDHLRCRCVCGTEREVSRSSLERGLSRSCGCQSFEARRHIGEEDEDRLVAEYEAGKSIRDLAAMFGVSTTPIQRVLRARGVETRPARRIQTELPDAEVERLRAEYDEGASVRELARRHGYPHDAIRVAMERTGDVRRRRAGVGEFDAEQRATVVRRWREGETQLALAAVYDVSPQTIDRILTAEGIPASERERGGERHWAWKGGESDRVDGYVEVWADPSDEIAQAMKKSNGRVLKHRLVMAHHLGRALYADEDVHHLNTNRNDNRLENLELRVLHPRGGSVPDLLKWAHEIIARYDGVSV